MHIKIPFLAVLIITIFQLTIYGIQNNEHSTKELNQILTVQLDDITEISMVDLSGRKRHTNDPEQIKKFIHFFKQYQYKRHRNDETAYMPKKIITINFYSEDAMDFIIPYGKEVLISHKVYSVKKGPIEEKDLLEMFYLLPDN